MITDDKEKISHSNNGRDFLRHCFIIGVGSGAAAVALAVPIFWLVADLGPRFLNTRVLYFITKTQKFAYRLVHVS